LFSIPASAPNRRGECLIIAVSKQLPYSASQWHKDTVNHVIWVTLKSPSAQLPPITIGVCYIPPITSHQMALSSVTDRFDTLTRHIRAAVAAAAAAATPAHIMVAGDFNAKVGNLPDAWVSTFNEDIPARQSQDQGTNQHAISFYSTASTYPQCISSTKLTTPSRQLGPQHPAQQASVKRSQHPATTLPLSISARLTGTKHAAPYIVSGAERKGASQAHPLPLPF